jgi:hypothetical protein
MVISPGVWIQMHGRTGARLTKFSAIIIVLAAKRHLLKQSYFRRVCYVK